MNTKHQSSRSPSIQTGTSILNELTGVTDPPTKTGEAEREPSRDEAETFACHSEHATDLRMLDLRLLDGTRRALPYHYLEAIEFDPSAELCLVFPQSRVRVTGYRLHAIYAALLGHRVGYLRALGKAALPEVNAKNVDDGLGEAVVAAIEFVSPGDDGGLI